LELDLVDRLGKAARIGHRSFAYVQKEDGGEIHDGHYVFLRELGERRFRWRKWRDT